MYFGFDLGKLWPLLGPSIIKFLLELFEKIMQSFPRKKVPSSVRTMKMSKATSTQKIIDWFKIPLMIGVVFFVMYLTILKIMDGKIKTIENDIDNLTSLMSSAYLSEKQHNDFIKAFYNYGHPCPPEVIGLLNDRISSTFAQWLGDLFGRELECSKIKMVSLRADIPYLEGLIIGVNELPAPNEADRLNRAFKDAKIKCVIRQRAGTGISVGSFQLIVGSNPLYVPHRARTIK